MEIIEHHFDVTEAPKPKEKPTAEQEKLADDVLKELFGDDAEPGDKKGS